jgi:hypothetical protein
LKLGRILNIGVATGMNHLTLAYVLGKAIIDFKGIIIIQNCAFSKSYLINEPCNLVHLETIETTWGE